MASSEPQLVRALLDRPLQVVAGKGGVGRTVVSCALALRSARAGARTLLLEVNAPDNIARYLQVQRVVDDPKEVLDNLWICKMTPAGALKEYALLVLKFKALYQLVFENKLVKYLLRSIPSLAEFTFIGKAWYHSTQKTSGGRPRFDRIIIDAPATGHAITLLSVARTVAEVVPTGTMQHAADVMAKWLESKDLACMHVVALPEEMPVNEAVQLAQTARTRLDMATGVAVINRMLVPVLEPGELGVVDRLTAEPVLAPYAFAAKRRVEREAWQAECARRLEAESGMPVVRVPELEEGSVDRAWLDKLVAIFDGAAGG